MPVINFEEMGKYLEIPNNARILLGKSEKEIAFDLNLLLDRHRLLEANCYLVYYNTVRGPAKGGIRVSTGVTLGETRELAELMVWKTALTGIPFGGGKAGIAIDPEKITYFQRSALIKEFVHMIRLELDSGTYIPAPDLGSTPADMATIYGETHKLESVTGKPPRIGGLPGRNEATGCGVAYVAQLVSKHKLERKPGTVRVAIQGFGNVGSWAARFLHQAGFRIVAVSDVHGGIYRQKGIEINQLVRHVEKGKPVTGFPGDKISNNELLTLDVDILIPAAVGGVITVKNASRIKASIVVEAANGPTAAEADPILDRKGITVVPDILANSGGVIASYIEWRNAKSGSMTEFRETYSTIENILYATFARMRELNNQQKVSYRRACHIIALQEVINSMRDRGWI